MVIALPEAERAMVLQQHQQVITSWVLQDAWRRVTGYFFSINPCDAKGVSYGSVLPSITAADVRAIAADLAL